MPAKQPASAHPTDLWQEQDHWCVRARDGKVLVFKTRDEAIAYSSSTFSDGASAARADTQRGDVAQNDGKPRQQARR